MKKFDYSLDYEILDLRKQPELYAIGRGEQGVLVVQPYKSELLPYWKFRTPVIAEKSAKKIHLFFLDYLDQDGFVGADMARKYLQMGFTRSRRYANYKGGRKYKGPVPDDKKGQSGAHGREQYDRQIEDPLKAKSAVIFKEWLELAKANPKYKKLKENFISNHT